MRSFHCRVRGVPSSLSSAAIRPAARCHYLTASLPRHLTPALAVSSSLSTTTPPDDRLHHPSHPGACSVSDRVSRCETRGALAFSASYWWSNNRCACVFAVWHTRTSCAPRQARLRGPRFAKRPASQPPSNLKWRTRTRSFMRWLLLEPRCVVSREHTHAAWYVCSWLILLPPLARRPHTQALSTPLEALIEAVGYHFVVYTLRTVRERALSRAGGASHT